MLQEKVSAWRLKPHLHNHGAIPSERPWTEQKLESPDKLEYATDWRPSERTL